MLAQSRTSSTLATLLAHPEVQQGMQDAHNAIEEGVFGNDDQARFADLQTEDDIIRFVDSELSRTALLRERFVCQKERWSIPSYWHHIGFTLVWLYQAMSYHQQGGNR